MLTLLRRMRRQLAGEKQLGPYLLYAAGEVFLIVIGILIALAIDGWNQRRQEAQREAFYLSGLQSEFHASLVKLDTLIAVNRKTYHTSQELLTGIARARDRRDEVELSRMLIEALSYEIAYNPNNSLLTEMMNSGRLQTLSDPELRQHLTSWESFVESVNRQEANLRNIRERAMDILLGPEGSILTVMQDAGIASDYVGDGVTERDHSNLPLLKSMEFENRLLLFLATAEGTESNFYMPLRLEILRIQERIDASLED